MNGEFFINPKIFLKNKLIAKDLDENTLMNICRYTETQHTLLLFFVSCDC